MNQPLKPSKTSTAKATKSQGSLSMINDQPKHRAAFSRNILLIGTKTGKCDFCKATKKVLLLKYGFTLCEDCLDLCTNILEEIYSSTRTREKAKRPSEKEKTSTAKESENSRHTSIAAKSNSELNAKVSEA